MWGGFDSSGAGFDQSRAASSQFKVVSVKSGRLRQKSERTLLHNCAGPSYLGLIETNGVEEFDMHFILPSGWRSTLDGPVPGTSDLRRVGKPCVSNSAMEGGRTCYMGRLWARLGAKIGPSSIDMVPSLAGSWPLVAKVAPTEVELRRMIWPGRVRVPRGKGGGGCARADPLCIACPRTLPVSWAAQARCGRSGRRALAPESGMGGPKRPGGSPLLTQSSSCSPRRQPHGSRHVCGFASRRERVWQMTFFQRG